MQLTCMPQGYKNSSGIFQRVMNIVLQGLLGKCCLVYLDDILVFGKSLEEHNFNLKEVRKRLENYNLKENLNKCVIGEKEVTFLEYTIRKNSEKPTVSRAQRIINYFSPTNRN